MGLLCEDCGGFFPGASSDVDESLCGKCRRIAKAEKDKDQATVASLKVRSRQTRVCHRHSSFDRHTDNAVAVVLPTSTYRRTCVADADTKQRTLLLLVKVCIILAFMFFS